METRENLYDVIVLGAGPAGSVAAALAAKRGLRVILIERAPDSRPGQFELLHPDAYAILNELDVRRDESLVGTVEKVKFLDAGGRNVARARSERPIDLVDAARLVKALRAAAKRYGAAVRAPMSVVGLRAGEEVVELRSSEGESVSGRLLIAANGCDAWTGRGLGLSSGWRPGRLFVCRQWIVSKPKPQMSEQRAQDELSIFFTSKDLSSYGYVCPASDAFLIGTVTESDDPVLDRKLESLVDHCRAEGVLSSQETLSLQAAQVKNVPRGLALDMETHVAKRALIVGDAGGFVPALSHDGLYAAVWSAKLAVEACVDALPSEHVQDALARFDARWRGEMVEFLRMPNADLRFLLPLVFTNDRMAGRLARAFLFGENT